LFIAQLAVNYLLYRHTRHATSLVTPTTEQLNVEGIFGRLLYTCRHACRRAHVHTYGECQTMLGLIRAHLVKVERSIMHMRIPWRGDVEFSVRDKEKRQHYMSQ